MPTKRTPIRRILHANVISDAAVEIYRAILTHESEIDALRFKLARALRRGEPWRVSVCDVRADDDEAPAWLPADGKLDWVEAGRLRGELERRIAAEEWPHALRGARAKQPTP